MSILATDQTHPGWMRSYIIQAPASPVRSSRVASRRCTHWSRAFESDVGHSSANSRMRATDLRNCEFSFERPSAGVSALCAFIAKDARCLGHSPISSFMPVWVVSMRQRKEEESKRYKSGSTPGSPSGNLVNSSSAVAAKSAIAERSRASEASRDWCLNVSRTTPRATSPPIMAARNAPMTPSQSWSHTSGSTPKNIPKLYRQKCRQPWPASWLGLKVRPTDG